MEPDGLSGGNNGIFSNMSGSSSILRLDMSLNNQQQENHNFPHQQSLTGAGAGKQVYPYAPKQRNSPLSDEEEPHSNNPTTTEDSAGDGQLRKGSPWQRMKWTDNMVRLLIMVVFYIGDEVGSGSDPAASDPAAKKKGAGAGAGTGALQKKGKWKSVSRAMMERGFYVSPQQCEDKFNDLNKRYKRVNDILGKGTACKVVENQSLLDSMDHLPAKMKEEARKLMNSKHLFFREMCAYHNSCGGGAATGAGVPHHSSPTDVTTADHQPHHPQHCVHSNDNDEEEEDDDDDRTGRSEEVDGLTSRKRVRMNENDVEQSSVQLFNGEVTCVIHDATKSVWEKRHWMKVKMMQLEEQRVGYEGDAFELDKQKLKWVKFSYKKEREMEVEKLKNERMKLENERMVIMLKKKELELLDLQQHYASGAHRRSGEYG